MPSHEKATTGRVTQSVLSVEIPREAIEAACRAQHPLWSQYRAEAKANLWAETHRLLEAALPHLPGWEPQAADASIHDPLTCELCHAEGTGAEIADLRATLAERERLLSLLRCDLEDRKGEYAEMEADFADTERRLAECVEALRRIECPDTTWNETHNLLGVVRGMKAIARSALTNLSHTTESVHRETDA